MSADLSPERIRSIHALLGPKTLDGSARHAVDPCCRNYHDAVQVAEDQVARRDHDPAALHDPSERALAALVRTGRRGSAPEEREPQGADLPQVAHQAVDHGADELSATGRLGQHGAPHRPLHATLGAQHQDVSGRHVAKGAVGGGRVARDGSDRECGTDEPLSGEEPDPPVHGPGPLEAIRHERRGQLLPDRIVRGRGHADVSHAALRRLTIVRSARCQATTTRAAAPNTAATSSQAGA